MEIKLSSEDKKQVEDAVRKRYAQIAEDASNQFPYPTGMKGLEALNYDRAVFDFLPAEIIKSFVGVGNPFSLGRIKPGDTVLDIGSGAGVDALMAARMVGPNGRVVGIDITPEMSERARRNRLTAGLSNIYFEQGSGTELLFPDESFDAVISNGVINLIPDKTATFSEAFRVLKPGGKFMVADLIRTGPPPESVEAALKAWTG